MFPDITLHKILFSNTLSQIERRKWVDFDFHRYSFTSTLTRIKMIQWVEVDTEKYDKIFNIKNDNDESFLLRSSRYCHHSFKKCFPSSETCYECFKYFCSCCDFGTNCMYGEKHNNRRCSNIIQKYYSDIYNIESVPKLVFMYGQPEFMFNEKKPIFCSREIYGY